MALKFLVCSLSFISLKTWPFLSIKWFSTVTFQLWLKRNWWLYRPTASNLFSAAVTLVVEAQFSDESVATAYIKNLKPRMAFFRRIQDQKCCCCLSEWSTHQVYRGLEFRTTSTLDIGQICRYVPLSPHARSRQIVPKLQWRCDIDSKPELYRCL